MSSFTSSSGGGRGFRKYAAKLKAFFTEGPTSSRRKSMILSAIEAPSTLATPVIKPEPSTSSQAKLHTPLLIDESIQSSRPGTTKATTCLTPIEVDDAKMPITFNPTITSPSFSEARAQRLAARYEITLEPQTWQGLPPSRPLVQKSIRMRIHRTCHHCGLVFGAARTCVVCEHVRCELCPRYPLKKSAREKGKGKDATDGERPIVVERNKSIEMVSRIVDSQTLNKEMMDPDSGMSSIRRVIHSIPVRVSERDLVNRPAMQRVRRTCHVCSEVYKVSPTYNCTACGHLRCSLCPRDPAKPSKHPDGYPNDVPAGTLPLLPPNDSSEERPSAPVASE